LSTWWRPARRADIGLDVADLPSSTFVITNRQWHVLYRFLRAVQAEGMDVLPRDNVLVPTNLCHVWGSAILSADMDRWFQLGEFDGEAVVPAGIVHESQATRFLNSHELVPLGGSPLGTWLNKIGQQLATTPTGLVISSRRRNPVAVELEKKGAKANVTELAKQTDASGNVIPPVLHLGLSWNARKTSGDDFDLDGSMVGLNENDTNVGIGADWFCFYNNQSAGGGTVRHLKGDNLTGEGEGDDEVIEINLGQVPDTIKKFDILITIHQWAERKQSFAEVSNAMARVFDPSTGTELVRIKLSDDAGPDDTAARIAQLYRDDSGAWQIKKFGDFYEKTGLGDLVAKYNIA